MDNFLLPLIIERIPELRFKYMGSYSSDTVPQLTKDSFAIINSASSHDRGELWITESQLDKTENFAVFWVINEQNMPFQQKINGIWLRENYKKLMICMDYTQFIQQFFFFNSTRETRVLIIMLMFEFQI